MTCPMKLQRAWQLQNPSWQYITRKLRIPVKERHPVQEPQHAFIRRNLKIQIELRGSNTTERNHPEAQQSPWRWILFNHIRAQSRSSKKIPECESSVSIVVLPSARLSVSSTTKSCTSTIIAKYVSASSTTARYSNTTFSWSTISNV